MSSWLKTCLYLSILGSPVMISSIDDSCAVLCLERSTDFFMIFTFCFFDCGLARLALLS